MRACASLAMCLVLPWLNPCQRAEPLRAKTGVAEAAAERSERARRAHRPPSEDRFSFDGVHWIDPTVPPEGYVRMTAQAQLTNVAGNALLLMDEAHERFVPIFVGDTEALSIRLRLEGRRYPRPLTHDLLERMIAELDARIVSVQVDELRDNVFFGTVVLGKPGGRLTRVDARPSDAVALAVGSGAPIFVAKQVLELAGQRLDELERQVPPATNDQPPATRL